MFLLQRNKTKEKGEISSSSLLLLFHLETNCCQRQINAISFPRNTLFVQNYFYCTLLTLFVLRCAIYFPLRDFCTKTKNCFIRFDVSFCGFYRCCCCTRRLSSSSLFFTFLSFSIMNQPRPLPSV